MAPTVAKLFVACWTWATRPESSVRKPEWIGCRKLLALSSCFSTNLPECHALSQEPRAKSQKPRAKNQTLVSPNPPHRRRRYALGEQHLLRAGHCSLYLFSESSRVFFRAGARRAQRCGARMHSETRLRVAQLRACAGRHF